MRYSGSCPELLGSTVRRAIGSAQFAPKWFRRQVTAMHHFGYDTSFTGDVPFLMFCLEVSTDLIRNVKRPWAPTFGQLHYPPASATVFTNLMLTKQDFRHLICADTSMETMKIWHSNLSLNPVLCLSPETERSCREADLANELCSSRSLTPALEVALSC